MAAEADHPETRRALWLRLPRPLRRGLRRVAAPGTLRHASLFTASAGLGIAIGLSVADSGLAGFPYEAGLSAPAAPVADAAPIIPVWRSAPVLASAFDVDAPRLRGLARNELRLRRSDGVSRDIIRFGEPEGATRHALIAVDRSANNGAAPDEALAELGRSLGLHPRIGTGDGLLDTKFGRLPTVDLAFDGPEGPKACLGFAFRSTEARLAIHGWLCNRGAELVNRAEAACLVDRLVTIGAGDAGLADLFARAELNRKPCPPAEARLTGSRLAADRPRLRTIR